MREQVLPAEAEYLAYRKAAGLDDHMVPPVVERLKKQAREAGLWNLFLPAEVHLRSIAKAELRHTPDLPPA
jgi:acyl-CoA dehydrogenase